MNAAYQTRIGSRVRPAVWLVIAYGLANLALLVQLRPAPNADWATTWWWVVTDPWGHGYFYSPVLLPVVGAVVWIGPWAWAALHTLALALLWRLGPMTFALFALSAFMWTDIIVGNFFTFVLVAAAFALRGSHWATLTYIALTLVMPRPVQLPLLLWLLWRRPDSRMGFIALFILHAMLVLVTGEGALWIERMLFSTRQISADYVLGPGAMVGYAWLIVGLPLAAWLTWRNHPALAGLVVSPYLLPQYLSFALLAAWPRLLRLTGRS